MIRPRPKIPLRSLDELCGFFFLFFFHCKSPRTFLPTPIQLSVKWHSVHCARLIKVLHRNSLRALQILWSWSVPVGWRFLNASTTGLGTSNRTPQRRGRGAVGTETDRQFPQRKGCSIKRRLDPSCPIPPFPQKTSILKRTYP